MAAPLVGMAARAAAKHATKKSAQKAVKPEANPEGKLLDSALVGLSAAKAAGAAGMAMGQEGRRDEAMKRDRAITRTENMQRNAAKARVDESARHHKGFANSTKQK